MIKEYNCKLPLINELAYIAENASLIGDIKINENSSIWYNAVLRADLSYIEIGKNSNVQDNVCIHVDTNSPCIIGDNVSIGHNAVIHGATIENNCLIGMGAIILNGAKIMEGSIVGAGSLITENMVVTKKSLAVGSPAKIITELYDIQINKSVENAMLYVELAKNHFGK